MDFTVLNILWLVPAFSLTTQEMVRLNVSPQITAQNGKPVTLQCNVSSESPDKLQIKYMEWSQNKTILCSMNSEEEITTDKTNTISDFQCEYRNQQLSLIFQEVQPMESGSYRCKLRSNQGATHVYSHLELEECCVTAEGFSENHSPGCTFRHVYPDGDVHWFHGSHHLSDGSLKHRTTKRVEEGGWLTITSYLERESSDVPYNCSLKSTKSGRYIASALVHNPNARIMGTRGHASSFLHNNGVTAMRTVSCISVLFTFTLK